MVGEVKPVTSPCPISSWVDEKILGGFSGSEAAGVSDREAGTLLYILGAVIQYRLEGTFIKL